MNNYLDPGPPAIAEARALIAEAPRHLDAADLEARQRGLFGLGGALLDVGDVDGTLAIALGLRDREALYSLASGALDLCLSRRDLPGALRVHRATGVGRDTLITAYLRAGTYSAARALALAETDSQSRCQFLGQVAGTLARVGRATEARVVLRQALAPALAAEYQEERDQLLERVAGAQTAGGDFGGALKTVDRIESARSRGRALTLLARGRARQGTTAGLEEVLSRLSRSEDRRDVLAARARAEFVAGRRAAAARTVGRFLALNRDVAGVEQEFGVRDTAIELAQVGDIGDARRVAVTLHEPHLQAEALVAIATALVCAGDRAAARVTLLHARSLVLVRRSDPDSLWEPAGTLKTIGEAQIASGDRDEGLRTLLRAADEAVVSTESRSPSILSEIVEALAGLGAMDAARRTSERLSDLSERVSALLLFADRRNRQWDSEGARVILREALDLAAGLPPREKGYALRGAAAIYGRLGAIDTARQLLAAMSEEIDRNEGYADLGRMQAWRGDGEGALETLLRIDSPIQRERALRVGAQELTRAMGGATRVRRWLARLPSPADRAFALLGAAEGVLPALLSPDPGAEAL